MVLSYILFLYTLYSTVLLFLFERVKSFNETYSLSCSVCLFLHSHSLLCVCFGYTKNSFYIYSLLMFFIPSCQSIVWVGIICLHSEGVFFCGGWWAFVIVWISCKQILFNFCLWEFFVLFSFSKDIFSGSRILGCQLFSFQYFIDIITLPFAATISG